MYRAAILAIVIAAAVLTAGTFRPVAQDPDYHNMADQRAFLGIPNFLNVVSSLPFAVAGLIGLRRASHKPGWATLFAGATLTAFGSAWYHLAPDNGRLLWDRLPMTLGFMGLLTAMVAERVSVSAARRLFGPLLAIGAGSVLYWYWGELRGEGDLRLYGLVQFGSILIVVLVVVLYPSRSGRTGILVAALIAYGAAKGFELADRRIFEMGHVVSGHTLKHLFAAGAVGLLAMMRHAIDFGTFVAKASVRESEA